MAERSGRVMFSKYRFRTRASTPSMFTRKDLEN
jgi:hypothetical protein